ncbi:MAG: hypothetical protein HY042_07830 [Spirochaetia bacterium]|nr:hypothetical protein [Spirochaetia bacterium]
MLTCRMPLKRVVILNPKSKNGKAAKAFERLRGDLEKDIGAFELVLTEGPGDCTAKVRKILKSESHEQVLIAGGDGSVNEAVNGYFENGKPLSSNIPLGVINLGTGGDFYKTLRKRNPRYHEALRENQFRKIDCGLTTLEKGADPRYFINITSMGLGGDVNRQMKASAFQRGMPAYFWHSLTSLFKYSPPDCRFRIKKPSGDWEELEAKLVNFFVCNAEYNGGGMRWAPKSDFEDGVLDLVLVSDVSKTKLVTESHRIYSGDIAKMTGVREFHGTEVEAFPARTVSQEIDGEVRHMDYLRTHEFYFRIMPKSIPAVM